MGGPRRVHGLSKERHGRRHGGPEEGQCSVMEGAMEGPWGFMALLAPSMDHPWTLQELHRSFMKPPEPPRTVHRRGVAPAYSMNFLHTSDYRYVTDVFIEVLQSVMEGAMNCGLHGGSMEAP